MFPVIVFSLVKETKAVINSASLAAEKFVNDYIGCI
jgi:hypothetical protein